jgi:hypothetical protein
MRQNSESSGLPNRTCFFWAIKGILMAKKTFELPSTISVVFPATCGALCYKEFHGGFFFQIILHPSILFSCFR